MPRPTDINDLISFPPALMPSATLAGILATPQWWTHIEQASLFLIQGFADAVATHFPTNRPRDLYPFLEPTCNEIGTIAPTWLRYLPSRKLWSKCGSTQVVQAMSNEPMLIIKAAIVILAFEKLIMNRTDHTDQQKKDNVDNFYENIRIIPAVFTIDGFNEKANGSIEDTQKQQCIAAIMALGVPRGQHIMTDMAKGQHATYEVAEAVVAHSGLPDLVIRPARRANGARGNTKPACQSFRVP